MQIIINGITITDYLDKYQCQINDEYDTSNSFEAIDGTKNEIYLGCRRTLQVDFEPMSTAQINELFSAIKQNQNRGILITYIDPLDGLQTRTFKCDSLPTATYFEADYVYDENAQPASDEKILFWTLPTVTFIQKNLENMGGAAGLIQFEYRLYIDGFLFTSDRIGKDLSITNSISANGFSVGAIASCGITGKLLMLNESDVPRNNSEIVLQKRTKTIEQDTESYTDWFTIGIFYLKEIQITKKIMSFSGLDSAAFLDNNYYINYQRDDDGNIIPQSVSGHITAVSEMVANLINQQSYTIPRLCDDVVIQPTTQQNARTLIQKAAESGATNYRQKINYLENDENVQLENFTMGANTFTLHSNQISDLSYGRKGEDIETIILYCGSTTKLPTHVYPTMYQEYNIYIIGTIAVGSYPKAANTLEVQTPYYPFSAAAGGGNFQNLLNVNFGTEFSVSTAKINEFIPIGSEIYFADENLGDLKFYATSISYKLTVNGIFASISGTSRDVSDYFYVGGMQRQLMNKISLNSTYNNIYIDSSGVYLAAPKVSE